MRPLCLILPALALVACTSASDGGDAPAATVAQADVQSAAPAQPAAQGDGGPAVADSAFTEILSLEAAHDYFADGRCSACQIVPSAETVARLQQTGATVRTEPGRLSVVAPSADVQGGGDPLAFEVRPSDPQFAAYTEGDPVLAIQLADISLAPSPSPDAWIIEIMPGADVPVPATIRYTSRRAQWHWIILLGDDTDSLGGWTVRRESAPNTPVDHDPPQVTALQDGRLAWQIILREILPLREQQPADRIFMLVPPPGADSGPIRLPSAAPEGLRAPIRPGAPWVAEIVVFL